ncbi:hypothetical protein VTK56DRAFT_8515 [Thermocarpiscus australiensis]
MPTLVAFASLTRAGSCFYIRQPGHGIRSSNYATIIVGSRRPELRTVRHDLLSRTWQSLMGIISLDGNRGEQVINLLPPPSPWKPHLLILPHGTKHWPISLPSIAFLFFLGALDLCWHLPHLREVSNTKGKGNDRLVQARHRIRPPNLDANTERTEVTLRTCL